MKILAFTVTFQGLQKGTFQFYEVYKYIITSGASNRGQEDTDFVRQSQGFYTRSANVLSYDWSTSQLTDQQEGDMIQYGTYVP